MAAVEVGRQDGAGRLWTVSECPMEALGKMKNVMTQICLPKRTGED